MIYLVPATGNKINPDLMDNSFILQLLGKTKKLPEDDLPAKPIYLQYISFNDF